MAQQSGGIVQELAGDARAFCRRTWWTFLIGGIASVVFGVLAFANPGLALLVLGMFFAAYLLVDGAVNIWGAITQRGKDGWWAMLLFGILGVAVGVYALLRPPITMIALIYTVAFMAIVIGATLLALGWKIRKIVSTEWMLYVTGILSIIAGVFILARPGIGGISVVYTIATWAVLIGILRIVIAFRVKNLPERVEERLRSAAA
jgi:uncharacterized membrane protein HdeD (DUF308 family)